MALEEVHVARMVCGVGVPVCGIVQASADGVHQPAHTYTDSPRTTVRVEGGNEHASGHGTRIDACEPKACTEGARLTGDSRGGACSTHGLRRGRAGLRHRPTVPTNSSIRFVARFDETFAITKSKHQNQHLVVLASQPDHWVREEGCQQLRPPQCRIAKQQWRRVEATSI